MEVHKNDKIIYIKRALPFVHDQISSEAMQDQLAGTHRSIGSYFNATGRTGTGLDYKEEKFLMAQYFSLDEKDPKLSVETTKFYEDISTKIPGKKGLELNIGLQVDNSKPVSPDNMPINLIDFLKYRHATGYGKTAPSPEKARGNPLIEYYVEDPTSVLAQQVSKLEMKDNAMIEYLRIKDNNDTVNMVLSLMKQFIRKEQDKPPVNLGRLKGIGSLKEKQLILSDLVSMRPEKFHQVVTDPNIRKKYFIDELITVGIIRRVGNTLIDTTDNNRPLGFTESEVLTLLNQPLETSTLSRFKQELDSKYQQNANSLLTV